MQNQEMRTTIVRRMVEERGLRAQLRTGSLITGQLYVALSYFPKAAKVRLVANADIPEIPIVRSTLPELEEKLGSIIDKLDRLPLDAIGDDLRKSLATLEQTLKDGSTLLNRIDTDVVPALNVITRVSVMYTVVVVGCGASPATPTCSGTRPTGSPED